MMQGEHQCASWFVGGSQVLEDGVCICVCDGQKMVFLLYGKQTVKAIQTVMQATGPAVLWL